MNSVYLQALPTDASMSDSEVIERVLRGDTDQFEIIMRRFNPRVYRVTRSVLGTDEGVEDVMQSTYIKVFRNLGKFAGRASFSTWLLRISIHEALAHRKKRSSRSVVKTGKQDALAAVACHRSGPLGKAVEKELTLRIGAAIDELPILYRAVFIMRALEGISTADTARMLNVSQEVVKSRLHRARNQLRQALRPVTKLAASDVYPFHLLRCDRVVGSVMSAMADCSNHSFIDGNDND